MTLLSIIFYLIFYAIVAVLILLVLLSIILLIITPRYPVVTRDEEEETFIDPTTKLKVKFPSISEEQEVNLSVIVPAFNEEERLPPMLEEALEFLEKRLKAHPAYKYEIIVVSDGSEDDTVGVVHSYAAKYGSEKIRCLNLITNRGKGGAVRLGVENARGALILFADADGASKFEDVTKLEKAMELLTDHNPVTQPSPVSAEKAIVIGSRAHLEEECLATRSVFRNILMYGFHFLVWLFTVKGIRDTQCGFKLFTRKAANICFRSLHVNRWAFDVELLYIAQTLNIPISEIPVTWTEIEGSKVTPVFTWAQMGLDLGLIWLKYNIGAWKIRGED